MPGVLSCAFLERLRGAAADAVASHSAHLRVDADAAAVLGGALAAAPRAEEVRAAAAAQLTLPVRFESVEAEVKFLAMYHMLRVGSGWDEELRARCGGRGAAEMTQYAVLGMHIGGQRMDAPWMAAFSNLQVQNFFAISTHDDVPVPELPGVTMSRPGPLLPLATALRELVADTGAALEAEGSSGLGTHVVALLRDAAAGGRPPHASALAEELCGSLPGFDDAGLYDGQRIVFARKAQALAAALHVRFGASDARFAFPDASDLCADSGPDVVAVLRAAGVLVVSGELEQLLDAGEQLPPGPHERALRCAAIVGCDAVVGSAGGVFCAHELGTYLAGLLDAPAEARVAVGLAEHPPKRHATKCKAY